MTLRALPPLLLGVLAAACTSGNPVAPGTSQPPAGTTSSLASIALQIDAVVGGETVGGTATLSAAAAAGGTAVTLQSSHAAAKVPASVTVPAGATSATFSVETSGVAQDTSVVVTGSSGGVTRTASLTVRAPEPAAGGPIAALEARHDDVIGGDKTTATITLDAPAAAGGVHLALASDDDDVIVPDRLTIPQGARSGTFEIATEPVASAKDVRVTVAVLQRAAARQSRVPATASASFTLTIRLLPEDPSPEEPVPAPTLTAVSPASGVQGSSVDVTLTGTTFLDDATTAISGAGVAISDVVVVSATSMTATLTIDAGAAVGARTVTVTTAAGTSGGRTFTVVAPAPAAPTLTSVTPADGVAGTDVDVTLTGTGFIAGADVDISGTGVTVSGVSVDSATAITATFSIDAGATPGARSVTVTTAGGTTGGQTFTVLASNSAPVSNGDAYTTDEDVVLTVGVGAGVLANDTDADADTLTASLVSGPSDGSLTLNADGSFTYTPDANFNGSDSFTYRASDGDANDTAIATIMIAEMNDAPVAEAGAFSGDEGITCLVIDLAANDPDGDALLFALATLPVQGELFVFDADVPSGLGDPVPDAGTFQAARLCYKPLSRFFHGSDSFTFTATDGTATSAPATISITLNDIGLLMLLP